MSQRPAMRNALRTLLVLALAAPAAACSGSQSNRDTTQPFTPQLAQLFDDAVDYVEDVEGLGGRIAADWQTQIDGLSRESNVIGVARIETVLQGSDSDGSRNYNLTALITDQLRGRPVESNRVGLRVSEGQTGFNTVEGKEARLQAGRYMLFVRWYTDGAGEVRAHWHLSPYTDALNNRVRHSSGIEEEQLGRERVVHQEGSSGGQQQQPAPQQGGQH